MEVGQSDLNSRLNKLQSSVAQQQADDQLQSLKEEMGMLPPKTEETEEKVRNIEV